MNKFDHPSFDVRHDSDNDVKNLLISAKKRREQKMKYHLISELLKGETIDITKNAELYEALNREHMEFEEILKLHPEQTRECVEYVKERKKQQGGRWWNPNSDAKWGEKGVIPPCIYFARPKEYWTDKRLTNDFLNTFKKFRIAEGRV